MTQQERNLVDALTGEESAGRQRVTEEAILTRGGAKVDLHRVASSVQRDDVRPEHTAVGLGRAPGCSSTAGADSTILHA